MSGTQRVWRVALVVAVLAWATPWATPAAMAQSMDQTCYQKYLGIARILGYRVPEEEARSVCDFPDYRAAGQERLEGLLAERWLGMAATFEATGISADSPALGPCLRTLIYQVGLSLDEETFIDALALCIQVETGNPQAQQEVVPNQDPANVLGTLVACVAVGPADATSCATSLQQAGVPAPGGAPAGSQATPTQPSLPAQPTQVPPAAPTWVYELVPTYPRFSSISDTAHRDQLLSMPYALTVPKQYQAQVDAGKVTTHYDCTIGSLSGDKVIDWTATMQYPALPAQLPAGRVIAAHLAASGSGTLKDHPASDDPKMAERIQLTWSGFASEGAIASNLSYAVEVGNATAGGNGALAGTASADRTFGVPTPTSMSQTLEMQVVIGGSGGCSSFNASIDYLYRAKVLS